MEGGQRQAAGIRLQGRKRPIIHIRLFAPSGCGMAPKAGHSRGDSAAVGPPWVLAECRTPPSHLPVAVGAAPQGGCFSILGWRCCPIHLCLCGCDHA